MKNISVRLIQKFVTGVSHVITNIETSVCSFHYNNVRYVGCVMYNYVFVIKRMEECLMYCGTLPDVELWTALL